LNTAAIQSCGFTLADVGIDRRVRTWEKPSDHVPLWLDLALEQP
jgi:exonuclease III